MMDTFGKITVRNPKHPEERPIHLTFTDRSIFDSTTRELISAGYEVTDAFWGFEVYQTTSHALRAVELFLGKVEA